MFEMIIGLFSLSVVIFEISYLFIFPIFKAWNCKVGDCYEKKHKIKNPFIDRALIKEQYIITAKEKGYIQYKHIDFYRYKDGREDNYTYHDRSEKAYVFFILTAVCFIKKIKNHGN